MFKWLKIKRQALEDWTIRLSQKKHAPLWLGVISFTESSFFPIPPDFILISILLANKGKRWAYLATITTLTSVLGAMFGYMIGYLFVPLSEKLISLYGLQAEFQQVGLLFNKNAEVALFVSAFTPIPFKVFTIASGLFKVNFLTLILVSIVGRGLRFFLVAFLIHKFGTRITALYRKHATVISLALLILGLLFIWLVVK